MIQDVSIIKGKVKKNEEVSIHVRGIHRNEFHVLR